MEQTQYNANNAWNWNSTNWNNNNKSNTNYSCWAVSELDKFADKRYIQLEDLYDAYFACRKNKRKTYNAIMFELDYESELLKLWEDINNGTYTIGKSICFVVHKPKKREVFAADFRDRIVHHLVIGKLEPLFEADFITDTYNCRKKKGVLFGVNRLRDKIKKVTNYYTRDAYIAKFDCKGFFMSIDKAKLWEMLEDYIMDRYEGEDKQIIIRLTKQIVLHCPHKNCRRKSSIEEWADIPTDKSLFTCGDNYGIPIGNLSSQVFANFYLNAFDHYMNNLFNWFYGRYVDDFYVMAENKADILSHINDMREFLAQFHVTLHPTKIYLQHYTKGVKFTGGVIKYDRIYMSNSTVYNFENAIGQINKNIQYGNYPERAVQRLNSYIGFSRQYSNYRIRRDLLFNKLSPDCWHIMHAEGHLEKFLINKNAKTNNQAS